MIYFNQNIRFCLFYPGVCAMRFFRSLSSRSAQGLTAAVCILFLLPAGCRQRERSVETRVVKAGPSVRKEFDFLKTERKENGIYYKLKPGEGLYTVSRKYNIPIATLIRKNDIEDIRNIPSGKVLFIPRDEADIMPDRSATSFQPVSGPRPQNNRPVAGRIIARFSTLRHGVALKGVEFETDTRCSVHAVRSGTVSLIAHAVGSFGPSVIVRHSPGKYVFYGNLSSIRVEPGEVIGRGAVLGVREQDAPPLHIKYIRNGHLSDPGTLWK